MLGVYTARSSTEVALASHLPLSTSPSVDLGENHAQLWLLLLKQSEQPENALQTVALGHESGIW